MDLPTQPTSGSGSTGSGAQRDVGPSEPEPSLHVASAGDQRNQDRRDDLLMQVLVRGDLRDAVAGRRDRAADERLQSDEVQAALDRAWAARDRDAAAADRADLVQMLRERDLGRSPKNRR